MDVGFVKERSQEPEPKQSFAEGGPASQGRLSWKADADCFGAMVFFAREAWP